MTTARPATRTDGSVTRAVTRTAVVAATPAEVFAVLADPREHAALDGSGLVRGVVEGPDRLAPDAVFVMRMAGYTTTNTVVEFVDGRVLAWRHRARHVWRWELTAVAEGTAVSGTFDHSAKRAPRLVRAVGMPGRAGRSLDGTLAHLITRFGAPGTRI